MKKSSEKSFGILFGLVFIIVSVWPLFYSNSLRIWSLILAIIFFLLAFLKPSLLKSFNNAWIKLGELLGRIIAPIIMAIVYFLILTPISLLVRLFGKDLIGMKFSNDIKSYWIKRKKHLGSMDKQF